MIGEGTSYRDKQRVQLQCAEWGEEMVVGSLTVHMQTQHGKE